MTRCEKGSIVPGDGALTKTTPNSKVKDTAASDETPLPGLQRLTEDQAAEFRRLVHRAMAFGDPSGTIRMDPDSDKDGTIIQVNLGMRAFHLLIYGWCPTPRLSVAELADTLRAIAQAGAACESVADILKDQQQARKLINAWRARIETADDMTRELETIAKTAWSLVDLLADPSQWRGPIPAGLRIDISEVAPVGGVKA
jgi:hypothetical protein